MRKIIVAVSAMSILMTGMAFAEADHPAVDQPTGSQEQRTEKGMTNGQTELSSTKPDKQQKLVNKPKDKAKPGGVMTKEQRKDWEKIGPPQNRTSRINARMKQERAGRHK